VPVGRTWPTYPGMRALAFLLTFTSIATAAPTLASPQVAPIAQPASEVFALGDTLRGPWTCTGTATDASGGSIATTGALTLTVDAGKWWIRSELSVQQPSGAVYRASSVTSYDPAAKVWTRTLHDNLGGTERLTSAGLGADHLVTVWLGERHTPDGALHVRRSERRLRADRHDDGVVRVEDMELTTEVSLDGRTWTKADEMHCKTNRSANYSRVTDFLWTQPPRPGSADVRLLVRDKGKPLKGEQDSDVEGRFRLEITKQGRFAYGLRADTNPNGRIVYNGLMPGKYRVSIRDTREVYQPWESAEIDLVDGKAVTLTVDLAR
jgi:hypothetical protein